DDGEAGDGSDADIVESARNFGRATICVSSQVGCAVDCRFCLTGLLGVKRNLTAGEIAGQVMAVLRDQQVSPPHDRINLVFMGMGEPFLNYDSFIKAERVLRFQRILIDSGTPTFIRRPRGRDIYAACGQLKQTMEAA